MAPHLLPKNLSVRMLRFLDRSVKHIVVSVPMQF